MDLLIVGGNDLAAKDCLSLLYKSAKSMILSSCKSVLTGIHHLIVVRCVKWTKKMIGQLVYYLTWTKAVFTISFILISTNLSPLFNAISLRLRHPAFVKVSEILTNETLYIYIYTVWNCRHMCSKRSNANRSFLSFHLCRHWPLNRQSDVCDTRKIFLYFMHFCLKIKK